MLANNADDELATRVGSTADRRIVDHLVQNDDDDALFEELEKELDDDFDMAGIRERRIEELKREFEKVRDMRETNHGRYIEVTDEKEAIQVSAKEELCVMHFFHRDFARCKIMDKHLEVLATKYFSTRFVKVSVEKVPWLVDRLQVQVLPCVGCFIGGKLKHRLIGFEELGNDDSFATAALELRLSLIGVIEGAGSASKGKQAKKGRRGRGRGADDEDEDESD